MSFKYNPFTNNLDRVPDLSGYWKNDGSSTATGDWDLGTYGINANDAYFNNGSTGVYLNDGTFALNVAAGNSYFTGSVGIGYTTSAMLGVNYLTSYARLGDGSNIAGVFENSGNVVNLADGTYAIHVSSGSSYFSGLVATGAALLVAETSPYDNSVTFECNGKGGFNNATQGAYFAGSYGGYFFDNNTSSTLYACDGYSLLYGSGGGYTIAIGGYGAAAAFQDNAGNTFLAGNGADAINSTGNVKMQGLLQGAGAPATILTNFNLYVDNTTGQLYLD